MELTVITHLMKTAPAEVVAVFMLLSGAMAFFLKWRNADVAAATSLGKLQQDHLTVLMSQNKQLADDLDALRKKMAETYDVMERMRSKQEDMRAQINELEDMLREQQRKCDTCPGPKGRPVEVVYAA
jgi:septal ring factor EnvC (AmiA/AmiB activator)